MNRNVASIMCVLSLLSANGLAADTNAIQVFNFLQDKCFTPGEGVFIGSNAIADATKSEIERSCASDNFISQDRCIKRKLRDAKQDFLDNNYLPDVVWQTRRFVGDWSVVAKAAGSQSFDLPDFPTGDGTPSLMLVLFSPESCQLANSKVIGITVDGTESILSGDQNYSYADSANYENFSRISIRNFNYDTLIFYSYGR